MIIQSIAIIALFLGVSEREVRAILLNSKEDPPADAAAADASGNSTVPLNPNIPPMTTTMAVANMTPLFIQFANKTAKNYTNRGEKWWQSWAGDMEEYGDFSTNQSNARPPYNSTL